MKLTKILAATTLFAAVALLVVACSSTALSPTSPLSGGALGAANACDKPVEEICGNKVDDDCDGQVDENCSECKPTEEVCDDNIDNDCDGQVDENCVELQACSPGYWRNAGYPTHFNAVCQAAANASSTDVFTTCAQLLYALGGPNGCKGSDAACHRQEAATLLNTAAGGCFE